MMKNYDNLKKYRNIITSLKFFNEVIVKLINKIDKKINKIDIVKLEKEKIKKEWFI